MTSPDIDLLRKYLSQTLGLPARALVAADPVPGIPRYLHDRLTFYTLDLWGKCCLVMVEREPGLPAVAELAKQLQRVEQQVGLPVIYAPQDLTARQRKRLVEQFIPFVVPGRQLFLPPLGIDLREHQRHLHAQETQTLSPAAQAVLLGRLLGLWRNGCHASELARYFGYSAMTLSRVKRELVAWRILRVQGRGAMAGWQLDGEPATVWRALEPGWRSPVVRQVWVKPAELPPSLPLAGLSALAQSTMLSPPTQPVYAIGDAAWSAWRREHSAFELLDEPAENAVTLEIWCYDPLRLIPAHASGAASVDRYSLYLSLRDQHDERIGLALEELME